MTQNTATNLHDQLHSLYLGQAMPPQCWQVAKGSVIDLLDELEGTLTAAAVKVSGGKVLDEEEMSRIALSNEAVKSLIAPLMEGEPTFDRLRGLVLIGRYELFLDTLEY